MVFSGKKQPDKTVSTDAADTHGFDRNVFEAITIEQHPAFRGKRQSIILQCLPCPLKEVFLVDMKQNRRLIDQPSAPRHFAADLGIQIIANPHPGLGDHLFSKLFDFGSRRHIDDRLSIETVIPDLQRAQLRQLAQAFTVSTHARHRSHH
ncbi:hypothetical protein D3C87_1430350 [compost metagenome]